MKQKLSKLKIVALTILTSTLMTMIACDKKDSKGSTPVTNPGCANCFANPMTALQGLQSFTGFYDASFTLDLLVTQSGNMMNWQDPLALGYYSGPVALQGFLDIQAPSANFCYLTPGRYTVTTTQPGVMYAKTLSGLGMSMTGPGGQVQATLMTAVLTNTLDLIGPRIAMTLRLDSVNGYMCGVLQTAQF